MFKWLRKKLGYQDGYIILLHKTNDALMLTSIDLQKSLRESKIDNDELHKMWAETISENIMITLKIELANAAVKSITDDRDELQVEHEALLTGYDKVRESNDNLKRDLDNSAARSEKYLRRCLRYEARFAAIERALRDSVR